MANTVRFQAPLFNSTEVKPYFINPCCFGDDVGSWIKPQLQRVGYEVEGPDQEDWGWYLVVRRGGRSHYLNIGHTGDEWQIIVEPQRGLRDRLRGLNKTADQRLVEDLHKVLTTDGAIAVEEWLDMDKRGRESNSTTHP